MVDDNGNAYYVGGTPPKDCNDWLIPAFTIDVLKYDISDLYKEYMKVMLLDCFMGDTII